MRQSFTIIILTLFLTGCSGARKATERLPLLQEEKSEVQLILDSVIQLRNNIQIQGRALTAAELSFLERSNPIIAIADEFLSKDIPNQWAAMKRYEKNLRKLKVQLKEITD